MRVCLQCGHQTDGLFCPIDGIATVVRDRKPATSELPLQSVFAGRYRITSVLGRGGMGAVYEARHTGTGQPVAVKTLLLDATDDPQAVQRFFLEAKRTAGLQHPNTVRVFDFGQSDEGIFYLVMERLNGLTLAGQLTALASEGQTMAIGEAARIAVAVLRSLGEAHRAGLVHRDLKPANVFLHDIGEGETVVKVLDFGIAKQHGAQLTQSGASLGTPAYMSPEQVTGAEIDGRSDLYALGIMLFQCVTGSLPFSADSAYTVMMKHLQEPAPTLGPGNGVPPEMAAVISRALAKHANERFDSASAMREALEPLISAPVQAPSAAPAPAQMAPIPPGLDAETPASQPPPDGQPVSLAGSYRWPLALAAGALAAGGLWWGASQRAAPQPPLPPTATAAPAPASAATVTPPADAPPAAGPAAAGHADALGAGATADAAAVAGNPDATAATSAAASDAAAAPAEGTVSERGSASALVRDAAAAAERRSEKADARPIAPRGAVRPAAGNGARAGNPRQPQSPRPAAAPAVRPAGGGAQVRPAPPR